MANEDKQDEPGRVKAGSTADSATGARAAGGADPLSSQSREHGDAGDPGSAAGETPAASGSRKNATGGTAGSAATGTDRAGSGAESRGDRKAPPSASPPPAGQSRGSGRGGGFAAGVIGSLLVLALAIAAGYFTRDRWAPPVAGMLAEHLPVAPAASDGDDAALASIDALEGETADLRSQIASSSDRVSSLQEDVESLRQNLDGLRQEVDQVAAAPSGEPQAALQASPSEQPDVSQPLDDIDQRLSELEAETERLDAVEQQVGEIRSSLSEVSSAVNRTGEQTTRPAATVLAVNQLSEALGRSGGYAEQLDAVREIAGDDAALTEPIKQLEQWSSSGLATVGELRARFPEMARTVAQSDYRREGDSWVDSVTNRLTSLVTVRRVGEGALAAGGTDAALSEAQTALDNGDLAGAVTALESLQDKAAEAAAGWLGDAWDRLKAEEALADLRMEAISQLNAARG